MIGKLLGPQWPVERVGRGSHILASLLMDSNEPQGLPPEVMLCLSPPALAHAPYPSLPHHL